MYKILGHGHSLLNIVMIIMCDIIAWMGSFFVGLLLIECRKKVKVTPEQAMKSQRVSIGIALHFL